MMLDSLWVEQKSQKNIVVRSDNLLAPIRPGKQCRLDVTCEIYSNLQMLYSKCLFPAHVGVEGTGCRCIGETVTKVTNS